MGIWIDPSTNTIVSSKQLNEMTHALGLSRGRKKPYRNYFNTGKEECKDWNNLVKQGLATHRKSPPEMGGNYYHISDKGLEYVIKNNELFGLDKRIKHLMTLQIIISG